MSDDGQMEVASGGQKTEIGINTAKLKQVTDSRILRDRKWRFGCWQSEAGFWNLAWMCEIRVSGGKKRRRTVHVPEDGTFWCCVPCCWERWRLEVELETEACRLKVGCFQLKSGWLNFAIWYLRLYFGRKVLGTASLVLWTMKLHCKLEVEGKKIVISDYELLFLTVL